MRRSQVIAALVTCALACAGAAATARAADPTVWLCNPALASDPCRIGLETTIMNADGSATVENPPVPADPPLDCFYVYPTVSNQLGPNATKSVDPEEVSIAKYQAARFSQVCHVYAPMYRQLTLTSIFAGGFTDEGRAIAYGDVLDAFKAFLATTAGRPFVLIGHSQGTGVLRQLIREEVDPDPALRKRMVSALLLGGNVTVERNRDRGGDFEHVPLCEEQGEVGCVVAFSTFQDDPPADSIFGRPPTGPDPLTGQPARDDIEIACVNPITLGANTSAPVTSYVPSEPFALGLIAVGILQVYGGPPPSADTTWLQPADRYTARCERIDGAHVLKIAPIGAARHLNAAPDATWGLHLLDVNGVLGDLVDLVAAQTQAYLTAREVPRLSLAQRRRCGRHRVTIRLRGRDRALVESVAFRLRGKRVARVRSAPFKVALARGGRLVARVKLSDGRARTVTVRVRRCRR
jgi:hypothetical protein